LISTRRVVSSQRAAAFEQTIGATVRPRRPRPSVELPVTRRGRSVCGLSRVWPPPRPGPGHPHEWPRHARVAPLVTAMIFGLGVDVLGPRRIVLERWDRSDAVSVCAEAVDHGPAILADQAGAQLIPAPHRPTLWDAGV